MPVMTLWAWTVPRPHCGEGGERRSGRGGRFFRIPGGPFDAIVFPMSLHHIRPVDRALDHAHKLLKPAGLLLIEDFDHERVNEATLHWFAGTLRMLAAAGLAGERVS